MQELSFGNDSQNTRAPLQGSYRNTDLSRAKQKEPVEVTLQELSAALQQLQDANAQLRDQRDFLASANRRYAESFHRAPDAHVVTDQFGIMWQANHAASVLLHYPIAKLEHESLVVFLSPDSRQAFLDQLPHLQEMPPHHEFEYRVQPHSGPTFPAALTVAWVHDMGTRQVTLHWQIRDVSERWHAEKRLRDLARLAISDQEQDRKRISNALYGDIGQELAALSMRLNAVSETVPTERAPIRTSLETISAQLNEQVAGIQLMARGLYPPALDLLGLETTLQDYCAVFARQRHLSVEYKGSSVDGLPDPKRILLFRILQAALDRAAQNDRARRMRVSMDAEGHQLALTIEDDVVDFDSHLPDSTAFGGGLSAGREGRDGWGITEIRDRLELLGGTLEIGGQPGSGFRVTAKLPYE